MGTAGNTGSTGAQGPAGAVLYLDGGVVEVSAAAPPAGGAWAEYAWLSTGDRGHNSCFGLGTWTTAVASSSGSELNSTAFATSDACSNLKPLACCQNR